MTQRSSFPIAVLVSGTGTNLQAIIDAAAGPGFSATIVAVVSDRPGVAALGRAEAAGIPTEVVDWTLQPSREVFTKAICDAASLHGAEALVLAGFMRVLSPVAVERFPNRILNIHPSLLPAFPGAEAVEDALDHGAKLTGVTVHFVDEQVDHGPIIFQEPVGVAPLDTRATLHDKIQRVEHRIYPRIIDAFARGKLEVRGRNVVWEEELPE
jgi:formyltetrahydrofolate-dependent phosphoribosylglycinamide formyltransferase